MTNKKAILFLIGILCFHFALAQDETDALRYSFLTPGGSARLQGIGGAGVGLGGEPSMVNSNPATIGLFKRSDLSFTANLKSTNLTGDYLGNLSSDNKVSFAIPEMELVIASGQNRGNSKWKNFTFGIGLNRLANFNQNIFYKGVNNKSSYADQYLNDLNGGIDGGVFTDDDNDINYLADNYHQGIIQAYDTYLIDPPGVNGTSYWSSSPRQVLNSGHALSQSNLISTKGGINEFSLAFAGNYNDKLFIGGGLFVPSINFDRKKTFTERNIDDGNTNFASFEVREKLHTDGVGINGKFGVLYMINRNWRIGAAIHTPTYYSLHDTYSTTMQTDTSGPSANIAKTSDYTDGYPDEYDYALSTPWRVMGGISYIFTPVSSAITNGFLTIDYEYINYSASKFHFNSSNSTVDDKEYAKSLNEIISNTYKGASNIRIGGELKFDIFSARAGFSYMGNPYAESDLLGSQLTYSAGVGFRKNGFYADLTYTLTDKGARTHQPYYLDTSFSPHQSSPNPATVYGNMSNIFLTIGFKL